MIPTTFISNPLWPSVLLGLYRLFCILSLPSYAAFRILRLNSDNWTWTLIALLFFRDAVGSAASGSIWSQHGFWITSFLVIAIWQGYRRDSKRLRSARERSDGVILA